MTKPDRPLVEGTFELHVFLGPLDPPADTADRFIEVCRAQSRPDHRIKSLLLNLDYENVGFVCVMQTSRYCQGDLEDAIKECAHDAEVLRQAGFEVLREKVESVLVNAGVPQSSTEARALPDSFYFEFHVLVKRRDDDALDQADFATLRAIAADLSPKLGTPIPLSYNALKPGQRFLNARTYGLGIEESNAKVAVIEDAINATATLRVSKVIREFICSDDNTALDQGWLEPRPA